MLASCRRFASRAGLRRLGTWQQNATDPASAVAFARAQGCESIDMKFCDFLGTQQHITLGIRELDEDLFKNGIGFDGSSIRCWQPIHQSDMLLMPRPESATVDPFIKRKTLSLSCDIIDPLGPKGPQRYSKDPRFVLQKCMENLKSSGICDHARVGPEAEFFIFDSIQYDSSPRQSFYTIDSNEAAWNTGREEEGGNKGYKLRYKEGYFPSPPADQLTDIRNEMVRVMEELGLHVEASHHEVSTGGQCEIDFRFGALMDVADQLQWYKYIVRNVAYMNGKTATFMPKPIFSDNGSGMHQHYSLHAADGTNLFTGDSHAGLSEMGLHFVGGIIEHAHSILAFTNPLTNSYRRLVPGFEAPIFCAYSGRNRSAFIRIPLSHPKGRRIEFRTPDPCCNPYLAFAACVQAGLDGIKRKLHPGPPTDINLYEADPSEIAHIRGVPSSLRQAVNALKKDHAYLLDGGVFTEDVIESYIEQKEIEVTELQTRPTPWEFSAYFDA